MYSHQTTPLTTRITPTPLTSAPFHFPSPSSPQTMLDLRLGLASKHLSSFPPVYVPNTWKADFHFWSEPRAKVYDDNGGGCSRYAEAEVEFPAQKLHDDDSDTCSPRLGTSPLLPSDHEYSYPSPRSRSQAIVDGRRELMEMIQDLPESSYELSLKDIVDEKNLQAEKKDIAVDEASLNVKPEVKTMLRNNKNRRRGPILRSTSMDSGVFLLKMFFPISLGSKKKPTGNRATISTRPSLERSEKTGDKEWWRMRFLARGESKNSVRSSSSGSTSSSSRSSSWHDDIDFTPGCWSFHKKYRAVDRKGAAE